MRDRTTFAPIDRTQSHNGIDDMPSIGFDSYHSTRTIRTTLFGFVPYLLGERISNGSPLGLHSSCKPTIFLSFFTSLCLQRFN